MALPGTALHPIGCDIYLGAVSRSLCQQTSPSKRQQQRGEIVDCGVMYLSYHRHQVDVVRARGDLDNVSWTSIVERILEKTTVREGTATRHVDYLRDHHLHQGDIEGGITDLQSNSLYIGDENVLACSRVRIIRRLTHVFRNKFQLFATLSSVVKHIAASDASVNQFHA